MADNQTSFQRLRQFLRGDIKGKFTNAMLQATAAVDDINVATVAAAKQNMIIWTAEQGFLDKLTSAIGVERPAGVGIDDDSYRNLAISINNSKTVSNIFLQVLELFYGADAVHANVLSTQAEPFFLQDGMDFLVQTDADAAPVSVVFNAADFQDISQATAVEVSTVIARAALQQGSSLTAQDYLDSSAGLNYVQLFSGTRGPRSSITVLGGLAQNVFRFPQIRPTTQAAGTQWTITVNGGFIRYTWTSGPDPTLQNIFAGDYAVIQNPPFTSIQAGTFTITKVNPDVVGSGYFEIVNPLIQTTSVISQGSANDIRFYFPRRTTLNNLSRFATLYEVNPYEIVIYIPATTQIIKRQLIGGWHVHETGGPDTFIGAYCFDPTSGVTIGNVSCTLNQTLEAGQPYTVVSASGSTAQFPDSPGNIILDFGTSNQEGPIKYLGRPSNGTLLLDASYVMKRTHANPDVSLVRTTKPYSPATDGTDYPTYLTGTVQGRIEAEALAQSIAAAGIFVNIIVVYPKGPGMNNIVDVYAGDAT